MEATVPRLWRSRNVIYEILVDRGYKQCEEDLLTLEEFEEWAGDDDIETLKNAMSVFVEEPGLPKILVRWLLEPKLRTAQIASVISYINKHVCQNVILVVDDSVTHPAKEIILQSRVKKVYIDCYTLQESQINIMKHELSPKKIELMTKRDAKRVLKQYNISKTKMPCILSDDKICRHFGAIKGQMFRIYRESTTNPGKLEIAYRIVR